MPVEEIARALEIRVVFLPLEGNDDLSGYFMRQGADQLIGVNSSHPRVRQRFTVAHELGHALLDQGDGIHFDQTFRLRDARSGEGIDADEIHANAFAASLLMPESDLVAELESGVDITDDSSLRMLARKLGVSVQALVNRLDGLGWNVDGKAAF